VTAVAGLGLVLGMNCDAVLDIKQPHVRIVSPADGDSVKGSVLVRVEADDASLSKVVLYIDDSLYATGSGSPLEATVALDTSRSTRLLRAVAYDRGGNWSEASATVVRLVPRVSLTIVGTCGPFDFARDLAVAGQYAYVAERYALVVLNLANPTAPVKVGSFGVGGSEFCDVHVAGNVVCAAVHGIAPVLLDVSNPSSPRLLSALDTCVGASGVYCDGSLVYAVDGYNWLYIADISTPTAPRILGGCHLVNCGEVGQIVKSEQYVYAMCDSGIEIIDVADPTKPASATSLRHSNGSASVGHLAVCENTLYYASGNLLRKASIATPRNPTDIDSMQIGARVSAVAVDDSFLCVGSLLPGSPVTDSLRILSLAGGASMSSASTPAAPRSAAVADSFVYVACARSGIAVYVRRFQWVVK
jgi:hypothetical protein